MSAIPYTTNNWQRALSIPINAEACILLISDVFAVQMLERNRIDLIAHIHSQ